MKLNYHDALALGQISGAHPGGFTLTKKLFENIKLHKGMKILDAGSGMGETSLYLAEKYSCTVYAVDNHPDMAARLRAKVRSLNLPIKALKANLEKLPFPEQTFDLIVSESATVFSQIDETLHEFTRTLKPSGELLMVEMTAEDEITRKTEEIIRNFYQINKIPTESEWVRYLKQAGFRGVKIIKSKTIFQELQEIPIETSNQLSPLIGSTLNPEANEILSRQSALLAEHSHELGYRVITANKMFKAAELRWLT